MREVSGTMYSYSFLCWRKLWLFSHNITMEHNSENVKIGKEIDNNSFERQAKHIMIDGFINIDFIKDGVVFEIKKSSKQKEMAINQIKYYLYTLYKKGMQNPRGVLSIPDEREREDVILKESDIQEIEERLKEIRNILEAKEIPAVVALRECKKCSYFDLCYV